MMFNPDSNRYVRNSRYLGAARTAPRGVTAAMRAGAGLAAAGSYYAKKWLNRNNHKLTARQKKNIKKRGGVIPKQKKSVKAQIKELKKSIQQSEGVLIYRKRGTSRLIGSVNQQSFGASEDLTIANLETVLAQLRFFNPAAPATLTQGSGASGTYYREYLFKSIHTNVTVRNNYQIPCKCTLYVVTPKEDTNISATTAYTDGLADVGNPSYASPLCYLTDSDEFNDLWKIQSTKVKMLMPGEQMHSLHSVKDILYSPATYDSHALAYQKRFGSYQIIVRIDGVLAHDSSADQQGFAQCGCDIAWDTTFKVEYDAGVDLKFIYLDDTSDSFTNGALVSSMPVADNIPYSLS